MALSDKQNTYNQNYFDSDLSSESLPYSLEARQNYFNVIANSLVHLRPNKVLDIGCAKGFLVFIFNKLKIEAYGLDISSYAIDNSPSSIKDKLFNIDIEKERLPFSDKSFDLVIGLELIEHLFSLDNLLTEIKRIMKKEGYIFFTTPQPGSWDAKRDSTHINIHPRLYWINLFKRYGFLEINNNTYRAFKKEFIKNYKKNIDLIPPVRNIGIFLCNLGWLGRMLRREMQVYLNFFSPWKSTQLFLLRKINYHLPV